MATNIPGDINQTRQRNASPVAKKQTSFDATNTPGIKPAAVPPVAAPGYSSFSPVRDLQRADDSRNQRQAVAAAGVTDKVDQLTAGSVDKLMQDGAVATAKPVIPTPLATGNNPQRAAQMQAQFNQPVTRGTLDIAAPIVAAPIAAGVQQQTTFDSPFTGAGDRLASFGNGVVNTGIGVAKSLAAAPLDWAHQGVVRSVDGNTATMPGGGTGFRDNAFSHLNGGISQISDAFNGFAPAARGALGVEQAPNPSASPAKANPAAKEVAKTASPEGKTEAATETKPELPEDQYTKSTVDGVVGRKGQKGQEYSNMPGDVEGALDPSQSKFRVGMQRGDARSAIESNEAALVEQRKMSDLTRKAQIEGEIGNGPGNRGNVSEYAIEQAQRKAKVTGSATDRANFDRLAGIGTAQSASARKQAEEADPRWKQDADRQKAEAEIAKATTDQQLSDANAQQQTARARNLAVLEQMIVDPSLTPEQRAEARQNYDVLTTPVDKRYVTVKGGQTEGGADRASQVFDAASGTWVAQQGEAQQVGAPPGMTFAGYSTDGKKVFTDKNGKQHVED
jgi:hypothetical protein